MVLLGIDPHKDTHTVVAVDPAGRHLDQRTVPAPTLGMASWSAGLGGTGPIGGCGRWRIAGMSPPRLERDLLAAGEPVVGVPPRLMAGARQAVRTQASPTRSTPWRSPAPPCANPTCPPPAMTRRPGSSGCWSTIASTWSPNPPRRSTGCAGTCTSSTRPGTRHPAAARSGPGSQHRLARPGRRRPRLRGAGQDLPGPGHRHPGPHRPDRPAGPSTAPTRRPAGPVPAQPARLRAADRGQAHRRDRWRGPVRLRGRLCHARRRRPDPGQLRPHRPPPAVTRWQPPAECRPAPHRDHPAPPLRPRPELLPATPRPGRWDRRGPPGLKRRIARAVDQRLRAALPPADIIHTTAP
jgi:hypothetical protein